MSTGTTLDELKKGAIIGGVINGIINGFINWFTVKDQTSLILTDNMISSTEHTVFAGAVPLAVSLAFILTSIAYFTSKLPNKPSYFPRVFLMALKHSFFAFGIVVAVAIMIQRFGGSISVTPFHSAVISGIIAALVGGIVNYLTSVELLNNKPTK
jgi:hypothetical protein